MDKETLLLAEKILYTIGIVTGFWKFVDAFFSYMHKRQRGFVSDVVEEKLKDELLPIKNAIDEIKKQRERDNRYQNEQLQNILSELRKP